MRKVFFFIALLPFIADNAQSRLDDTERICIHAVIPAREALPHESAKLLESKLSQMVTHNGIADNEYGVRFVLTAKVNVLSKDIVAGPPTRISQKLDIILMLGDIIEDKVYSQHTITTIGIGQTEEKAFIAAFKNINPKSESISVFLKEGKAQILDYYQTHCENIIADAREQASLQHYEDALLLLSSIPDVCTDCLNESSQLAQKIYVQMINARGEELLNEARNIWANSLDKQGATEATSLLAQINFAASCQPNVDVLLKQITAKMNEIDRREWQHQMELYQDDIEREKRQWEQQVREYDDKVNTQRMYLKACRDVAIENARHQPKVVTRVVNYNRVILW